MDGDRDVVLGDDAGPVLPGGPVPPRSGASAFVRHPATLAVGAVALAFAVGAGVGLLRDDDRPPTRPVAAPSPSPSPSPAPVEPSAPAPTSAAPSPSPAPASDLHPSCSTDAVHVAVCRFVRALQTDDVSALTEAERQIADVDDDLPDDAFSVTSCELEGDVTVLCEVAFTDDERTSAGFRLAPSNGEYDAETGQVVVEPGQTLAYEVVEAVGLRRDGDDTDDGDDAAATPAPAAPTGGLVLGGDELGVTRVGAPYEDAVRAVSRVLGPPVADPSASTSCVGAGDLEVEWRSFRLAVTDGKVSGWLSSDARLRTPSGLGIWTTVAQAQQALGDGLRLYEPNADGGAGFTVDGVELGGGVTETGPAGRITSFWSGACAPP